MNNEGGNASFFLERSLKLIKHLHMRMKSEREFWLLSCFFQDSKHTFKIRLCRSVGMSWSATQRQRLAYEKSLLEKYFQNRVTWINPTEAGETKIEVLVTCSNDKQYILRVYLPPDFPNSVPPMIVKTPSMTTLKKRNGNGLHGIADHTYGVRDGCTQICHFKPDLWKDNNTLYQVVMKGLIWLEAYQAHLRTGQPLNVYLSEMSSRGQSVNQYRHTMGRKAFAACVFCVLVACYYLLRRTT